VTEYVIICQGVAGYPLDDQPQGAILGQYLATYDPEAHEGWGEAEWTTNIDLARRFDSTSDAYDCWRTIPASRPTRPDGKNNRPLTAFSITVEEAP
jgi:hypothetical protein